MTKDEQIKALEARVVELEQMLERLPYEMREANLKFALENSFARGAPFALVHIPDGKTAKVVKVEPSQFRGIADVSFTDLRGMQIQQVSDGSYGQYGNQTDT
jgi:hypothetical protein